MKRLHVHVGVHDLKQSLRFYSTFPTAAASEKATCCR
jgi:catechol 2,3-dioxygenase-like lactoylglutathione lyase family enzyme